MYLYYDNISMNERTHAPVNGLRLSFVQRVVLHAEGAGHAPEVSAKAREVGDRLGRRLLQVDVDEHRELPSPFLRIHGLDPRLPAHFFHFHPNAT